MKELYMSMMLSVAFILVFAIVLPIPTGTSPTLLIGGTIAMFTIVQVAFIYAVHVISPYDPLWYIEETEGTGPLTRIPRALAIGIGCSILPRRRDGTRSSGSCRGSPAASRYRSWSRSP